MRFCKIKLVFSFIIDELIKTEPLQEPFCLMLVLLLSEEEEERSESESWFFFLPGPGVMIFAAGKIQVEATCDKKATFLQDNY